jgi:hypothetical protein
MSSFSIAMSVVRLGSQGLPVAFLLKNNMLTYSRNRSIFHELVQCQLMEGHLKFMEEDRAVIQYFGQNINRLQAAV